MGTFLLSKGMAHVRYRMAISWVPNSGVPLSFSEQLNKNLVYPLIASLIFACQEKFSMTLNIL